MQPRQDIKHPKNGKARRSPWNFKGVRPGDSIHVKTERERANCLIAFRYWVRASASNPMREAMARSGAYATSLKVGDEDPDGPGYRIWFMAETTAPPAGNDEGEDI